MQIWDKLYHRIPGEPVWAGMPAEFHQTTWCAEKAIEFLSEERSSPWLMSFNCFDPHHAFDPPAEYLERYDPKDMELPLAGPNLPQTKSRYQTLDAEWAHNEPGYFHVGGCNR